MSDITNEIDEYFHPQAKILRMFSVPSTLYSYEVKDLRRYLWYVDKDTKIIKIGSNIHKSERCLVGYFQRRILDIEDNNKFVNSNLRVILVEDLFDGHGKNFILMDDKNRMISKNGKLVKDNEDLYEI